MTKWNDVWERRKKVAPNLKAWERLLDGRGFAKLLDEVKAPLRECEPCSEHVFRAFEVTPPNAVRVIIIGQDPYPNGKAMGLAFSVPRGLAIPPSLRSIHKSLGLNGPRHGDLTSWAAQGVFLLNPILTTRRGETHAHRTCGWQTFTGAIVEQLVRTPKDRIAIMAWGDEAQKFCKTIGNHENVNVFRCSHPAARANVNERNPNGPNPAFRAANHFKKANEYLSRPKINWLAPWA